MISKSKNETKSELKKMSIELDGYLGEYKGHKVYLMDPKDYFDQKDHWDGLDYVYAMSDTDILIHRGNILGKLTKGKNVTPILDASLSDFYKQAAKKTNKYKVEPVVVTERHSVDWYTDHTTKMLDEGVAYGESKLSELAAEGKRRSDAVGAARDSKVIT